MTETQKGLTKSLSCDYCSEHFETLEKFREHLKIKHKIETSIDYILKDLNIKRIT